MSPQGESTGICIEDAVVFARAILHHKTHSLPSIFATYERFRRPEIDAAVAEANMRWETIKDSGWLAYRLKCAATPWFIWWTERERQEAFSRDYSDLDLPIEDLEVRATPQTWTNKLWQRYFSKVW